MEDEEDKGMKIDKRETKNEGKRETDWTEDEKNKKKKDSRNRQAREERAAVSTHHFTTQ